MQEIFRERQVEVDGLSLHVVEAGPAGARPLLFLHGWPECWEAFRDIMTGMRETSHVVALDLPGIGGSRGAPSAGDKQTLAGHVHALIGRLALEDVTLVGHDVGGQITYACLKRYPGELRSAVIMNVAIPGVDPWPQVKANPRIWHFAFHALRDLPETLVAGRESAYFDYFYDTIAASPGAIGALQRARYVQAYARPEALHAGFEWYRGFAADERDNLATQDLQVRTPVLYLRGDKEGGDIGQYAAGLRASGVTNLAARLIGGSGHFAPDEQPRAVIAALSEFIGIGK